MRNSLRVGSYAGIDIGLHWSVGLIAVLLTVTLTGSVLPFYADGFSTISYFLAAVALAGLFLVSVVAHELGHSVVAERNGVKVKGITLFALGGVAALESEPKTPGVAAKIAVAGPLVSVAVGLIALVAALGGGALGLSTLAVVGFAWLGVVNLILAVFNMIPALPLDGGRVLQAGLWKRSGDQHQATVTAATVGRYIGWAIIAFGVWQFLQGAAGLWTVFIGFFIITTARGEEFRARMQRRKEQWEAEGWGPPQSVEDLQRSFGPWAPPRSEDRHPGPQGFDPPGRGPGSNGPFGSFPPRPETRKGTTGVIEVDGRLVDGLQDPDEDPSPSPSPSTTT